jgi:hypothetical protein
MQNIFFVLVSFDKISEHTLELIHVILDDFKLGGFLKGCEFFFSMFLK